MRILGGVFKGRELPTLSGDGCRPAMAKVREALFNMLAARGIIVSHQTIRLWAEKFGRTFANQIRQRSRGRLGDKWHLDEVVISIRGKKSWLGKSAQRG